ncbi:MAG: hypothetical protein HOG19_05735 [Gammaproteobacteria bacterium]|nr:hypothetical protein [Gammaproteobacteria bacterium]
MTDGFLNEVTLGGTILIPVQCRNGSDVPTEPDSAPTYNVFGPDGSAVAGQTGTMALTPGSITGLRGVVLTASAGSGYSSDGGYTIHIAYEISSTSYSAMFTIKVT